MKNADFIMNYKKQQQHVDLYQIKFFLMGNCLLRVDSAFSFQTPLRLRGLEPK